MTAQLLSFKDGYWFLTSFLISKFSASSLNVGLRTTSFSGRVLRKQTSLQFLRFQLFKTTSFNLSKTTPDFRTTNWTRRRQWCGWSSGSASLHRSKNPNPTSDPIHFRQWTPMLPTTPLQWLLSSLSPPSLNNPTSPNSSPSHSIASTRYLHILFSSSFVLPRFLRFFAKRIMKIRVLTQRI